MFPPATNGAHRSTQNGYVNGSASDTHVHMNGDVDGVDEDVPIERLEEELPVVEDGLVPLAEVVSRIVQACYAELSDLAETLPPPPLGGDALTDEARKQEMVRKQALARFCQRWKKQITKLYAVAKWSRDAHIIQKCMNITAFLLSQNEQFVDVIHALTRTKEELSGARVRNHDLLTSLDVLTTGAYQRLPADIRKRVFAPKPLDDTQIARTLERIEAAIRFRLRVHEIVPVEMSSYRVDDGRAFFTVPGLFEVSICLLGMDRTDSWFFTSVEFLFDVGGELVRDEELPKKPTGHVLQWISDECDTRLGFYSTEQPPASVPLLPSQEPPQPRKPRLEDGVVDAPLVRLFNFLQMMSMSYQLEILWQQAERLRYLGWGEYLSVRMSEDRHTLTLTYWLRPPPPAHPTTRAPAKIPLYGGTLSIGLVSSTVPRRTPRARVLAELQSRARLAGRGPGTGAGESPGRDAVGGGSLGRPSDEVESLRWEVWWEPQIGAIGSRLLPEDAVLHGDELQVDPANLDVEKLLRTAIQKHVRGFFRVFLNQMQNGAFALRDAVSLVIQPDGSMALRTMLCADETVFTALDARTGRIKLWDTGDLGAAGRGSRFTALTERVNENPGGLLIRVLVQLRLNTIIDLAQQKAQYLGYQTYKMGNFHDHTNFGRFARAQLYIQLAPYPSHYLVLVVTDDDFRYALISASPDPKSMYGQLVMNDIGWLDVSRICTRPADEESTGLGKRRRDEEVAADSKFKLETNVLRELYAYCCARVAHMNVEKQFKQHSIPYKHVFPASSLPPSSLPTSVSQIHSALSSNIPSLCVQSADIIKEDKALDAAMPNIRVIPLAWWTASKSDQAEERPPQVVTCVKLRYVQQPVGRRAGAGGGTGIIRPSKSIVYDANEAIVCFLADEVEGCVELFMKEWNSVSKIVAIAREVAQMAKRWDDVRLLSFDLQTVEFAYSSDFVLSVTCDDPTDPSAGSFHLYFSRLAPTTPPPSSDAATTSFPDAPGPVSSSAVSALLPLKRPYNPHSDAEPFFLHILRTNPLSCLPHLVDVLRNTVPIVAVLEDIRAHAERSANFNSNSASLSEAVATATQSTPADWSWADVDTYPKSAGWWRVTFGPGARHALDFRLLHTPGLTSGDRALPRVTILDASYVLNSATSYSSPTLEAGLLFKPIPGMREIVRRAVKNAKKRTCVASVDVGAVCEISDVESVGRELWKCVLAEFKVMDSGGTS